MPNSYTLPNSVLLDTCLPVVRFDFGDFLSIFCTAGTCSSIFCIVTVLHVIADGSLTG